MSLSSSKVVVVGGSSGIGQGVAQAALDRRPAVVLVGRSREKLRSASQALGDRRRLTATAADVTREDDVARMFGEIGPFDHLVVPRGVPPIAAPVESLDIAGVRGFIDVMQVSAITL